VMREEEILPVDLADVHSMKLALVEEPHHVPAASGRRAAAAPWPGRALHPNPG
jgi:hypothetical protein